MLLPLSLFLSLSLSLYIYIYIYSSKKLTWQDYRVSWMTSVRCRKRGYTHISKFFKLFSMLPLASGRHLLTQSNKVIQFFLFLIYLLFPLWGRNSFMFRRRQLVHPLLTLRPTIRVRGSVWTRLSASLRSSAIWYRQAPPIILLRSVTRRSATRRSVTRRSATRRSATRRSATRRSVTRRSMTRRSVTRRSVNRRSVTRRSVSRRVTGWIGR